MIHNISRFIAALALLATAQGAWADTETVSYVDADGTAQTPVEANMITSSNDLTKLYSGWYVVTENTTCGSVRLMSRQTTNIILCDGATLSVTTLDGNNSDQSLVVWGQTQGTGTLDFEEIKGANVSSVTVNSGKLICSSYSDARAYPISGSFSTLTVNGGEVSLAPALYGSVNGNVVFNGGVLDCAMVKGNVTLSNSRSTDHVKISEFGGTVTVALPDGYAYTDGSGNYYANGTLTDAQKSAIAGKTLNVAPDPAHFSVNDAGTEYTIKTATGWGVFCDLLADNAKGYFDGKTVRLGANITVTRMAGGDSHDFTGTFDGGGNTLTFTATATDNYCAPFRHVQGASAETPAVISNLNVVSTVTADDYRHPAGLIAMQSGYVSVTDCNVEAHISNTKGTANPSDLYPAALVSQSNNTGVLTVSGCTTTGQIATDGKFAAGLVGIVQNTATIENCRASVTIQSTTSGDGTHGGLVASQPSKTTITITGCVFDGRLLGSATNCCGGFIGYRKGAAGIYNSLFAPTEVTVQNSGSATFARNDVDTHNCYYTYYLCDGEHYVPYYATDGITRRNGHATRTVTAADDVTIEPIALTGTATQYTVSGITAYSGGGLQRGQTLYYGSGDQLSLTLSNTATVADGYTIGYTATNGGTISGSTLTMPDADVTVTATVTVIPWDGDGSKGNPFLIEYPSQLDLLAYRVNGTHGETRQNDGYSGKYFKLANDIKYTPSYDWDNFDSDESNFEAIGGYNNYNFCGHFDGNNKTIRGIRIYCGGTDDADANQGIFGWTGPGADIHDLTLADARITGFDFTGGIVGYNYGTVSRCHVADDVAVCAVQSDAWNHGGIVGYNSGYIEQCTSAATLTTADANSRNYGGIAGINYSTMSDNLAIGATVPATADNTYGAITGNNEGSLQRNYYAACKVAGTENATGVGCGGSEIADITANNGALPAYRLALGANITTPPGTFVGQTEWLATPPVDAQLAPENGFTLAGNHYFASGYEFTPGSTLASGAAQGYTPRATLGGVLLDLYTPTGDTDLLAGKAIARLTITADCDGKTLASTEAIYSTGQPVTVAYIKADGTPGEASAIALDGKETSLAAGWYFVGKDISYNATLTLDGDVNLILADGKTMKIRISKIGDGIIADGQSLHIYGQSEGTGALNAQTNDKFGVVIRITNGTLGIHGGNVNTNAKSTVSVRSAIRVERATAGDALVIDRGTLTASSNSNGSCGIYIDGGDVRINGGQVTATGAQLGIEISDYVDEDDESLSIPGILTLSGGTLTASSFKTYSGESWAGTLAIAPGLTYTDGTSLYDSTTETATLAALGGKTLQPCLALANAADNTAAIADHAGQTLAVALSGRTLYKDGSWNTLCLPFDISTESGTLSGDNVQAMTLNTTTSSLTGSTLTLNFDAATGQTIPAGTPFIIKWDGDGSSNITNPVFEDVTVSNATNDATVEGVLTFTGTYAPVSIGSEGDNTKLYLGSANKLYYPTKAMTIGTHRAYFQLADGITAGDPTSHVRAFNLNFGDDEATGIISVHDSGFTVNGSDAWYTLDGRRLDGQPTAKGLYIHGGKKVAIK